MYYRKYMTEEKYGKLVNLSDKELVERIKAFPDQDLLNFNRDGSVRKHQIGIVAAQRGGKLDDRTRNILRNAFASITTLGVGIQMTTGMPEDVYGIKLWNFDQGGFDGVKVCFGITKEASGKAAVSVSTKTLGIIKIGYLEDGFVADHISQNRIVMGQWYKGQAELIFDAEELYNVQKPAVSGDGKYMYEQAFVIPNIQYETGKWDGHEANPGMKKVFEQNMNAFPVKTILESSFKKNGLELVIDSVVWSVEDGVMTITADKELDGSQLLCVEAALNYLTRESGYTEDPHMFKDCMETDTDFLKVVYDTFETRMRPSLNDVLDMKGRLMQRMCA